MALRTAGSVLVVFLLSVAVVLGQNGWRVTSTPHNICALKGSTVDLSCSYTYPKGHTVTETSWFYRWSGVKPQHDDRVEYCGDRVNVCTLRITDLRESDSAEYWFTFKTQIIQGHVFQSVRSERYSGHPGVRLSVTGLKANVQTTVTEGQSVTLTCSTTCTLTDNPNSIYIWYKNGQRLTNPKTKNNYLYLDPVSSEDTGRYSCAVNGHEDRHSPEETLTVTYCREGDAKMALRTAGSVLVVFLLSVAVVLGQNGWRVTSTPHNICALKGSTVDLSCSYTYPKGHTVTETSWFYRWSGVKPQHDDRVEYCGDRVNVCTLRITDLRESDSAEYWFTFKTQIIQGHVFQSVRSERYSGHPGVRLSVTGLKANVQTTVTEGQSVTLTCSTTCTLTDNPNSIYIWYKNGQRLTNPKTKNNYLYLDPVSSEDTGRYSCAVNGHEDRHSPEETLTVTYGPKRVSVSVSPSGKIVGGSSVTLTCSSDANPPVDKYTWYKKNVTSPKSSGQSYSITNISSEDSGQYYCEAENRIGAQKSTTRLITVSGKQASVKNASIGIIVVVLILILCLSGFMWFRKKASKSISDTRDTAGNGQVNSSLVHDNISGMAMTPTASQTVATGVQNDVHFASADLSRSKNQEVPLYPIVQLPQPQKQDEDVQYAAVKFNHPIAAIRPPAQAAEEDPSVVYSTVNTTRTKKTTTNNKT